MSEPKNTMTYTVGGRTVDAQGIAIMAAMQRTAKPKKEAPAAFHRGYLVEGFPPGYPEQCQSIAEAAVAAWDALPDAEKARRIKEDGARRPKPWDGQRWLVEAKRKKVRSKPYELLSAAEECKAIAERAGWTHVRVAEVKKEDPRMVQAAFA